MTDSRLTSRALIRLLGEWRGAGPTYQRLADGIRILSLDRRVVPGTYLPAERDLALGLGLSRTTVAAAYRSLRESGHIDSVRGSGSVTLPVGRVGAVVAPGLGAIDLHQASPPAWAGLAELYPEAARDAATLLARPGYEMVGLPGLRAAIADRYSAAGLATTPEQIIVTPGAQSAISLVAEVVLRRGDRSAVETPTYPHAVDVLRQLDTHPMAIPVDPVAGWDMERAEHVLRRGGPRLAYLMPDFHNPTGASMAVPDRRAVLEAARDAGVTVVIDETTADLDIDSPVRLPPFGAGEDPLLTRQLVTIGSLGKTVWGGLRIGWIRADHDLVARLVAARPRRDLGTAEFEQSVAERAIRRMPEILESRSRLLRASRDALIDALADEIPSWEVPRPHGGVALWVGLGAPVSSPLALAVRERGVVLSSGPRFGADGGHERHLRIPFTAAPDVLRQAVRHLGAAWREMGERGWSTRTDPMLAVV